VNDRAHGGSFRVLASSLRDWLALGRRIWQWRRVVVIFTAPDREIAHLNVAVGPCVPRSGTKRPLVGPFRQETGTPAQLEALFRVVVAPPAGSAWEAKRRDGRGRLFAFSDEFVQPLARFSRDYQGGAKEDPTDELIARTEAIATAWMSTRSSPRNLQSAELRIAEAAWWARIAQERGQHLYGWFGPRARQKTPARLFDWVQRQRSMASQLEETESRVAR
jgi:hypothetical protein